ncbi:hypothetical protein NP233_g9861 [Leucocoprinus birnbaumii]|uniref:GST N-terminal domain-containing protein n=1 Tax=Leucocoprinus birnbaumii TaxID=56174 RepID=A0AAD5YSF9_9AGAR|nr:hypothetical protein NP233_g9861 [Leucocoprinus birnbaumii]
MITFYDIAAKEGVKPSPPTRGRFGELKLTIRSLNWELKFIHSYILNYKKLPYKTVAFEYPYLEPEFKKLGIPPSSKKPDGTPFYTSPSIIDNETKTPVTDSYKITEYLDETYPDTPRVIPKGSEALQAAFYDHFWQLMGPIFPILLPTALDILNPVSAEYFDRTRSAYFGKPLKEMAPQGDERKEVWKKVEKSFETLDGWLNKSVGPFFMGNTITFADFTVAAMLQGIKVCMGENSQEWRDVMTWHNGRWKALLESLEPYASTDN